MVNIDEGLNKMMGNKLPKIKKAKKEKEKSFDVEESFERMLGKRKLYTDVKEDVINIDDGLTKMMGNGKKKKHSDRVS